MTLARFKGPLATVSADDTVMKAARTLRDRHVGCVVVMRHGRAAGIVTDRDLVVRVVADGRDPSNAAVGEFVSYDPVTVQAHEGIETAVERMRAHGVRRLPVVEDGVPVGIVTADDLFVLLGGQLAGVCEAIANRCDADESR
jgi:CBS domain-containing protein